MAPVLNIKIVLHTVSRQLTIKNFELTLESGCIAALLGPCGSGKSAVASLAAGETVPENGTVIINGCDTAAERSPSLLKSGAALIAVSQKQRATVHEYLKKQALPYRGITDEHLRYVESELGLREQCAVRLCDLSPAALSLLRTAAAFAGNPRLIVLERPYDGLDPEQIDSINSLLKEYCEKKGAAALLVTGSCENAESVCTRAIVLRSGIIVADIPLDQTKNPTRGTHFRYSFITDKPYSACAVLNECGYSPLYSDDDVSAVFSARQLNDVLAALIRNGISIYEVRSNECTLHERYFEALSFMGGFPAV